MSHRCFSTALPCPGCSPGRHASRYQRAKAGRGCCMQLLQPARTITKMSFFPDMDIGFFHGSGRSELRLTGAVFLSLRSNCGNIPAPWGLSVIRMMDECFPRYPPTLPRSRVGHTAPVRHGESKTGKQQRTGGTASGKRNSILSLLSFLQFPMGPAKAGNVSPARHKGSKASSCQQRDAWQTPRGQLCIFRRPSLHNARRCAAGHGNGNSHLSSGDWWSVAQV